MTVQEFFTRIWEMLIGRADGPLSLRLIFQPAVAAIFAIRAGLRDAREERTPYLWSVFTNPLDCRDLLRAGWKDIFVRRPNVRSVPIGAMMPAASARLRTMRQAST
jgi:hypothetical protein